MKAILAAMGFVITAAAFGTATPAAAYENCAVKSYAHCMACGARYGHVGQTQQNFCERNGFRPSRNKTPR